MSEQDLDNQNPTIGRVIDSLNAGSRNLDAATLSRLYDSRRQALAAVHAQHAGQGSLALRQHPVIWGVGLVSVLLLGAWMVLWRPSPHLPTNMPTNLESSDLDVQLLTGELPPQVFADWSLVTRENVESVCLSDS